MSLSDSDKDVVIPWVNLASELEIWDGMGCGVKLRDSARGGRVYQETEKRITFS